MAEFLLCTEDLPSEEAARLAGVSVATLRKWKSGLFRNVSLAARRRLRIYLAKREVAAAGDSVSPLRRTTGRGAEEEGVLRAAV